MGPPKAWVIVGAAAALLTASWDLWGPSAAAAVLGPPLILGPLLASALFGGLHNNPPLAPLMALATLINGLAWGGAAWLASRARAPRGDR